MNFSLLRDSRRDRLTRRFTYDALGNLIAATDARGDTSTLTYDAARRLLTRTAPAPYDSGPLRVRRSNTHGADGRLLAVSRSNGATSQVTQIRYTRSGQTESVTDANGNTTRFTYDLNDRRSAVIAPPAPDRRTRYTYDTLGRLDSVIDNTHVTAEHYGYTANGQLATVTDARGNIARTTYDGFDRLSQTTHADGSGLASSESLTHDAAARWHPPPCRWPRSAPVRPFDREPSSPHR